MAPQYFKSTLDKQIAFDLLAWQVRRSSEIPIAMQEELMPLRISLIIF